MWPDDEYGDWGDDSGDGTPIIDDLPVIGGAPDGEDGGPLETYTFDQGYYDNGDGSWTGEDGLLYDADGNWIGVDFGDGTWSDIDGNIFDSDNNPIGLLDGGTYSDADLAAMISGDGPGFWAGVGKFFSNLFGGPGSGGAGGGGFGGGGGMSSGQSSAQQKAQQAAQQLAQARAMGASPQTLAALQRQLAVAQAALGRTGGAGGQNMILIAAVVGLGVYALTSSRRRPNE